MAIPFPPTAYVYPGVNYTPVQAFVGLATNTPITYNDPLTLVEHVASITTNAGGVLTISTEGKSINFPTTGDGTAAIPVSILASP